MDNRSDAAHVRQLSSKEREIWLWRRCLGHPSFGYLRHLFPNLFLQSKDVDFNCKTCILAKSHINSYSASLNKSSIMFALIHSDVWGPSPRTTVTGHRWFVLFVNDSTRITWLYLMKTKEEVFLIFQAFHTMTWNQFSAKIQVLGQIMEGSLSTNGSKFSSSNKVSSMKPHMLRLLNRMVLLNEKIATSWKQLMPFFSAQMS